MANDALTPETVSNANTREAARNGEGSAFPFQESDASGQPRTGPEWGLTKREYFAAMAMQGLAADHEMNELDDIAKDAVTLADMLLKELAK